jgi:hypothetical protein
MLHLAKSAVQGIGFYRLPWKILNKYKFVVNIILLGRERKI